MRPNFVNVQLDFYGVKDFRGTLEWPRPNHIGDWIKRNYAYSLCDSPFGQYLLAVTMIAAPKLVDRIAFDVLRMDYGSKTEDVPSISNGFRTNTHLVSRFEIHMDDLVSDKGAWNFYQSQRNMAFELTALGDPAQAERLLADADIIKQRIADEMETALQWQSLKSISSHKGQYPRISSMLIDIFSDYKDVAYDWNRMPEPHLQLVKSR